MKSKRGFADEAKPLKIWLRGRDLNPRPLGYEPNELPDCSTPRHVRNPDCNTAANSDDIFRACHFSPQTVGLIARIVCCGRFPTDPPLGARSYGTSIFASTFGSPGTIVRPQRTYGCN